MLDSLNPFSDPMFKKQLLEKEGKLNQNPDNYEVLEPEEVADLKNIITSAPKLPKQAKNLILDASALAKNEKDQKAKEISLALNKVFSQYNSEYGLNLEVSFDSLSQTLVDVADEKKRRILQLYLSQTFDAIRPILIMHLIQRLALAIDYITAPERLFGPEMSSQDIFIVVEKLMQYIDQLNQMKGDIEIEGAGAELRKIAADMRDDSINSDENKEMIENFMSLFRKDTKL